MNTAITGHPPYCHDQIELPWPEPISGGFRACKRCAKLLTEEEIARYSKGEAHCSECTREMWRDIVWIDPGEAA